MEIGAALGFASATTALIGNIATMVIYVKDFKDAIKEHKKWLEDLKGLSELLELLRKRAKVAADHPYDPWWEAFSKAIQGGGTLEGGVFRRLEDRIQKLLLILQPKTGIRKLSKRLTYTLDKGEIAALFLQVNDLKSQLESYIHYDHFTLSLNIHEDVKSIRATLQNQELRTEELEEQKIIKWLSPLEFLKKQKETYDQSFPTGKWLLESVECTAWLQGRLWPLYCYGAPGAGKVSIL